MDSAQQNKTAFSLAHRIKSFTHAGRGVRLFFLTAHNAWIQIIIFGAVVGLGIYLDIAYIAWIVLVFAGGLVLSAEAFNSAVEIHMNLTSPEPHPAARDTKDVAAGAVLIAAITAAIVGVLVFAPYFI